MSDKLKLFLELKQYIDDSYENLVKIYDEKTTDEDKAHLLYETYANMADLEDELKHLRRELRRTFKIKDSGYKVWRKEQDAMESENPTV